MANGKWQILSGAVLGLALEAGAPGQTPPMPRLAAAAAPPAAKTNTVYVSVTAVGTNALESDYSNELVIRTTNTIYQPTLAWDAPTNAPVTNYVVHVGPTNRTYTNHISVGTKLTNAVYVIGQAPRTNRLIMVQGMSAGAPGGPWAAVTSWPALLLTNPAANRYYRLGIAETNF